MKEGRERVRTDFTRTVLVMRELTLKGQTLQDAPPIVHNPTPARSISARRTGPSPLISLSCERWVMGRSARISRARSKPICGSVCNCSNDAVLRLIRPFCRAELLANACCDGCLNLTISALSAWSKVSSVLCFGVRDSAASKAFFRRVTPCYRYD